MSGCVQTSDCQCESYISKNKFHELKQTLEVTEKREEDQTGTCEKNEDDRIQNKEILMLVMAMTSAPSCCSC